MVRIIAERGRQGHAKMRDKLLDVRGTLRSAVTSAPPERRKIVDICWFHIQHTHELEDSDLDLNLISILIASFPLELH